MCHAEREYLEREWNSCRGRKVDGMSTYIYLEIVSTLQRSRTTFISDVREKSKRFKLIEQKINYYEYSSIILTCHMCYLGGNIE